ncbi:MAG: hypothetical protein KGK08_04945 [Acidobacteriota bacterium]|nr:hypothetical protein [Acidobacteriota bacterium]
MSLRSVRTSVVLPILLSTLAAAPLSLLAQHDGSDGPPNVLVIQREYLKPGKDSSAHDKTEAAFPPALANGKSTNFYLGMNALSGPSRALFLSGYTSLASWESSIKADRRNTTLMAALDHAIQADGELLSDLDQGVFIHREDLSLNETNLVGARYFEIVSFVIRPGHEHEFEESVKFARDVHQKAGTGAKWSVFEIAYGKADGDVYLGLTALKSLADADAEIAEGKKFEAAAGEDGMKKLRDWNASTVLSVQTNLYIFNPKMSYPPPNWVAAEPDFWKAPAAPKKAAAKPAAPAAKPAN